MSTFSQILRDETAGFNIRLLLARLVCAPLPVHTGGRVRALALRLAGFNIGHGTLFWGMPTITGHHGLYSHLTIGRFCRINLGCTIDLGADITVGDNISIGHYVMLMSTSHEIGPAERRTGEVFARPIVVGSGAWLGARSVILPGVTIGRSAVVAAGAVVTKDVPPNVLVGGVPARVLRELAP